jgi:hypothetical protein
MLTSDVVRYHVREALRAGIAELQGNEELSRTLRVETKKRLISMSEEELWELAIAVCPPHKTIEQVYMGFKKTIDELKASNKWMNNLKRRGSELGDGDKPEFEII